MRNADFWRKYAPLIFLLALAAGYPVVRLAIARFEILLETRRAFASLGEGLSIGIFHAGTDEDALMTVKKMQGWGVQHTRIVSIYQAWGKQESNRFPRERLIGLHFDGMIPMLTWEPWLVDWDLPAGFSWNWQPLRYIASGGCDAYIRDWARGARAYKRALLLRFAHEMNNPYYPWGKGHGDDPSSYQQAWRRVRKIFHEEGADNVLWVWSPYRTDFEAYFPGQSEVDWIGYTLLNYGAVCPDSQWHSFRDLMDPSYRALVDLGRPIIITELGSLSAGGDPGAWARDALADLPTRYDQIRAVVFFHSDRDGNWIFPSKPYPGVPWPLDWTGSLEGLRGVR